jgi:hypothetical protein
MFQAVTKAWPPSRIRSSKTGITRHDQYRLYASTRSLPRLSIHSHPGVNRAETRLTTLTLLSCGHGEHKYINRDIHKPYHTLYCTLSKEAGRLRCPRINILIAVLDMSIGQSVTGGAGDVNMPLFIAATIFKTAADIGTDILENSPHTIQEAEDVIAATRSFSFYFSFSFSFSSSFSVSITHIWGQRSATQAVVT